MSGARDKWLGFAQAERNTTRMEVLYGTKHRFKTGFASYPGKCFPIELNISARAPFQRFDSYGNFSRTGGTCPFSLRALG